jgi:5-methylcytosine-specific restriction endonuclease McrA
MRDSGRPPSKRGWCDVDCSDDPIVDHYQPLAKGGLHETHNLVIACRSCNARKSAKDPEKFAIEIAERLNKTPQAHRRAAQQEATTV